MYIATFRVANYKSFRGTPGVAITPGFNVIVGQNNVGKTALVEALSLSSGHKAHRSLRTAPNSRTVVAQISRTTVAIHLTQAEMHELLRAASGAGSLLVPAPEGMSVELALQRFQRVLAAEETTWRGTFGGGGCLSAFVDEYGEDPGVNRAAQVRMSDGRQGAELASQGYVGSGRNDAFDVRLAPMLMARVYAFRAERFKVGAARFGHNTALNTDATNLPEVLNNLQGSNPVRFSRLNNLISTVFPVVK